MPITTPALDHALALSALATIVGELHIIGEHNHVNISGPRMSNGPGEIDVHECTPLQLEAALTLYPEADSHVDADGILRWVELDRPTAKVTFFRR